MGDGGLWKDKRSVGFDRAGSAMDEHAPSTVFKFVMLEESKFMLLSMGVNYFKLTLEVCC